MNEIILGGCTPTPLTNYLKALGILRLLSSKYPDTKAFWRGDQFILITSLEKIDIENFFLNDYQPTALITPWNGRGGFLEGESEEDEDGDIQESSRAGAQMVRLFSGDSVAKRFESLSNILKSIGKIDAVSKLNTARAELKRLKANEKSKGKKNLTEREKEEISRQEKIVKTCKSQLLQEFRNSIPEDMLDWFDSCLALVNNPKDTESKKIAPSPLLGAGGLDGSMDFGVNYLKRINDVFDPKTGEPRPESSTWLKHAIYGNTISGLISVSPQDRKKVSVGQFCPSGAGGSNAGNGFTGTALLNPWDTLLQFEGVILFSASATRRLEGAGDIYASLPFTVAPTAIGEAFSVSDESPKGAKRKTAEVWLPLWNYPAYYDELKTIFREGRITLRGKSVTNGFDFARAIGSYGTARGITSFQRIGFLKRSGDAFFALDLGRFDVKMSVYGDLIEELELSARFLTKLHSFVRDKTPSGEFKAGIKLRDLVSRLDRAIVRALRENDKSIICKVLTILGEVQSVIAVSMEVKKKIPPIPRLSESWVHHADDGSPAFRIAKALAGLYGEKDISLPLRAQIFPVHPKFNQWMTPEYIGKHAAKDPACRVRIHTNPKSNFPDALNALLSRRLWLAEQFDMQDKPLRSPAGVTLDDIAAFLRDDSMDARIAKLLPGLCLCNIPKDIEHKAGEGAVPAAFALLKLALTPDRTLQNLGYLGESDHMPVPAGMLSQLMAGNHGNRAVQAAWRRLRASSVTPAFMIDSLPELGAVHSSRVAAGLLIPLRFGAIGALARSVLKIPESDRLTTTID